MNTAAEHQDSAKTSPSNENPSIESLVPTDRDVCIGTDDKHFGNMLLMDLVLLHLIIRNKVQKKDSPLGKKEVDELATRLTNLFLKGRPFELSGLKDVPKPFLKGPGRILEKNDNEWKLANLTKAKAFVKDVIMSSIKSIPSDLLLEDMESFLSQKDGKDNESKTEDGNPVMQSDVIFLRADNPMEDNARSERQSGNRHFLFLASEHVSADTNESFKRVETVFKLLNSKIEINHGTEKIQKSPRYVIQIVEEYQTSWVEMDLTDLAEFTSIFIFEIYLEKQIHGFTHPFRLTSMKSAGAKDGLKPSTVPIDDANVTVHDVLFGRGGMTNSHPGNQRFRNIIGLHRPDYMQASKPNKPRVSRRIVLAIRQGNPPGRFLKKEEDGKWYDVGDQVATEKTSQGLRERSNAEKKERSALRKAIKTHNESGDAELPSEIVRASLANISPSLSLNLLRSSKGPPKPKKKKPKGETFNDSLPPNAVDKDGNILVTSHDILCGRGGLTNHHKGNKRFRDIVALHRADYVRAPKVQKPDVARLIVGAIRTGTPPGRFLRKDNDTGLWYDIGDKRATEKTSQALREKLPDREASKTEASFDITTNAILLPKASNSDNTKDESTIDAVETEEI